MLPHKYAPGAGSHPKAPAGAATGSASRQRLPGAPPTRRRMLRALGAGIAMEACPGALLGLLSGSRAAASGSIDLLTAPVKVPHDFVGMHAHRWPAPTSPSAAPTYAFGAARSHDHDGTSWNQIHLAPDRYAWNNLDRWVEAHRAAGRTLIYKLYGTPAWLAQRTDQADLYGRPGGAAPPRDLGALRQFLCAMLLRYNTPGQRGIHFIETWNEPRFEGRAQDFWWGSAEQLAALGRSVSLAAKSIDPGVRVLSPGFAGDLAGALSLRLPVLAAAHRSSAFQYLTASDGHGGYGSTWCDGIAFHTYNAALAGENLGFTLGIARFAKMLNLMHCTLPLYNTECGFIAPHPFRDLPPLEQALALKRLGATQAALGVQGLYFYSHDDDFVGNPAQNPVIAAAIEELHRSVAGSLLHQVTVQADGRVRVATEGGAFTW